MSAQDCIDVIKKSAGKNFSDDEVLEMLEFLDAEARRLSVSTGLDKGAALEQSAKKLANDIKRDALIQKRNKLIQARAKRELRENIRRNWSDRPEIGLQANLVGTNIVRQGSRKSIAADQKSLSNRYIAGLLDDLSRGEHLDVFASGAVDRDISKALWEINQESPNMKGISKPVREMAETIRKWQEQARVTANKAGANIGKLDNYIARQSHDPYKLQAAQFQGWADFIRPKLDPSIRQDDDFLHTIFDGLVSGVHLKHGDTGVRGTASLAKRLSQERVLHFKDADSWYDYNVEFGSGSVRESVFGGLDRLGESTALMQRLGPNPRATFDEVAQELLKDVQNDPKAARRLSNAIKGKLDNHFLEIDGTTRIPVNAVGARVSANIRALQGMSKLGGAVISAGTDLPLAASELKFQGQGFLGSLGNLTKDLVKGRPSAEKREILSSLSVFLDSMRGDVVTRFSADDSLGGTMTRGQRLFFKYNGLTWWTETLRSSAALMMSHNLSMNGSKSFSKLGDLKRTLEMYDITEADWDLIRANRPKMADGKKYAVSDGLPEEVGQKLRAYISDRATYAVIEPDSRTRAIMRQGTQPGTIVGELTRFIGQFKSFPIAILQKTIGRDIYGRGYQPGQGGKLSELSKALLNGQGEILGIINLMAWSTVFGYLAMSTKDLLKGREPRDPSDPSVWAAAMLQGGALGIYGDFLLGDSSRFGGGVLDTLAGPALGTAVDAVEIAQGLRAGDDKAAATLRLIQSNTPFINMFYTKAAMDYLFIYQIQEAMNPGYVRRLERRTKKQNNQEYWLSPRDAVGV